MFILTMPDPSEYTKKLEIECNAGLVYFHHMVVALPHFDNLLKCAFVSDIAKASAVADPENCKGRAQVSGRGCVA